ncbi:MAG: CinA family protein [Hyphomicrobiaceae bacterium]
MLPDAIVATATALIQDLTEAGLMVATAESCTGGLIAGALTEVPGSSRVVDRGFVTYTNEAKAEMLGVDATVIDALGAVSREVALAMAAGALAHSRADLAVAVTGVAGPGGGTAAKPVGLVHIAAQRKGHPPLHRECRFGDIGRSAVRRATVEAALAMLRQVAGLA